MTMGNPYSVDKKKKEEWINVNRVSRQEQYDWFKTLRDASDDDIVQIIRTSPQMITTVMYFDTFYIHASQTSCNCSFESELCISPNVRHRLDKSMAVGICPHLLLHRHGKSSDVLESSDEELDKIFEIAIVDDTNNITHRASNSAEFGFYWIHLAIIFQRKKVIKMLLPIIRDFEFPSFVWYTVQNWFSPLYLAVLHEDQELTELLWNFNPRFLQEKLRINFLNQSNGCLPFTMTMIERIASLDKEKCLKTLFNVSAIMNQRKILQTAMKGAFSTRAMSCIMFLLNKGIKLDDITLHAELNKAVYSDDVEMMTCLLKFHNVKVTSSLLMSAVKRDNVEMVKILLQYIPVLRSGSKDYRVVSACLGEAVLNNSKPIVELLIRKNCDVNICLKNSSVLKWATIFQFQDLKQILIKSGARSFKENESIAVSVFNSVLNINQKNDHLIRRLLEIGYDVNDASDGTPPFYTTMNLRRYDVMHALLLNGADPYLKQETWKYFLIRQQTADNWRLMVHVFVSTNTNLSCDIKITLLEYICTSDTSSLLKTADMVRLILLSAHTITEKDIRILKDHCRMFHCDILESEIREHLYVPKSLSIICRNSIRRKFGQNLHKFIELSKNNLPPKFVNLLRCTDVLSMFFTDCERKKFTNSFEMVSSES